MKINSKHIYIFLACLLALQLLMLINLKFTAWPEMTLWPYLITRGWLPYRDVAIAHTPLMLESLSIFNKIFGTGILQLKIFTWLLIVGTDVLLFLIIKKIRSAKTALITVALFAFWQLFFDGNGLWFDLFMGIFVLTSYYFVKKKDYLWAGIFLALAFISKQTAVWFAIPIGFELLRHKKEFVRNLKRLIFGALAVLGLTAMVLGVLGILGDFYVWAIKFGIFILPKAQGQIQLPDLRNLIISVFPFLIFIPLILKDKKNINFKKNILLLVWAAAGALGAYPRFEYFHLQPAIPFLAIAAGELAILAKGSGKFIKLFIPIYLTGSIYLFAGFFMRNFREGVRFYEKDVQDVATFVKSNTNSGDKIFVMNWWDNIYALSDRLPAVDPWVPQLSWYMDAPNIQEKMVEDLKAAKPKMIVLSPYSNSGLSAYIPQKVYNYVGANYIVKEKIDNIEILVPKTK